MNWNNRILVLIGFAFLAIGLFSFGKKKEKVRFVKVETVYGNMKFRLYNETPKHRDNFIKLTEEDFFDSLLFHRVIKDFMIQGGDPDSKGAEQGARLGNGGPGYDIDAEFVPELYHKKGVLAAAREGDAQNPLKRSSGSQFYIVQGRVFDSAQIMTMQENRIEKYRKQELKDYFNLPENKELLKEYKKAQRQNDNATGKILLDSADVVISPKLEKYEYTPEQIQAYTTVGGTPHLGFEYTVFGEMIEGFDVLDSISNVQTDRFDRPMEDVIMSIKLVKK